MYKSFADLESGLDFFKQFQESPLPESAILLPPNRQNASFYYVKNITRYINS